ncbi:hypothetical protein EF847_17370 [Actinobacteria bacterium YIM 96077]|uniref:Uncharacterized protein n=1 Tax=Phytoactinopolyspora halophila TaxID=1981511 RepID=A0A329QQU5_9ACTN|nr:hypothetical protein [Phytoactinopolyspora halophila]AYY14203.1 hypothetical protein EF847_17370 [Actinobacteria bacterium YIM 96077]RAW14745.1 hypothetical protein DPM12_09585 [Phytoactinopolyspora halophila]
MNNGPDETGENVFATHADRHYREIYRAAWRTVAVSSAVVIALGLLNAWIDFLDTIGGDTDRPQLIVSLSVGDGFSVLGVLSAVVIALVVEVDRSSAAVRSLSARDDAGGEDGIRDERDADRPGTDQPSTSEPDTDQPDTSESGTGEAGTDEPSTSEPDTDQPDTSESGTGEAGTDEPSTGEPDVHAAELSEYTVRLTIARTASGIVGYLATICGLLVLFTDSPDALNVPSFFVVASAILVFLFTLKISLTALSSEDVLRTLDVRARAWRRQRVRDRLQALRADPGHSPGRADLWKHVLAELWLPGESQLRAVTRRLLLTAARRRSVEILVLSLLPLAMAVALTAWISGYWPGVLGLGVAWFGFMWWIIVKISRDAYFGYRAGPSLELLFAGLIGSSLSALAGINLATGASSWGTFLTGILVAVTLIGYMAATLGWLLLSTVGAFGEHRMTRRLVGALEKRLGEDESRDRERSGRGRRRRAGNPDPGMP